MLEISAVQVGLVGLNTNLASLPRNNMYWQLLWGPLAGKAAVFNRPTFYDDDHG